MQVVLGRRIRTVQYQQPRGGQSPQRADNVVRPGPTRPSVSFGSAGEPHGYEPFSVVAGAVWVDLGGAGDTRRVTSDERCGEVLDGVQCQLQVGHTPEAHVAGRRGGAGRRSWLLGRDYDTDVADSELNWASGFPQP